MAYNDIQAVIDALSKRYSIDPEDAKLWRVQASLHAGHFMTIPDRARAGEGGNKWHLICVPDRVEWLHVYDAYSRDLVEQMAGWLTVTGPFTRISQIVSAVDRHSNYYKPSSGFKSHFPNEVVYAGRFFIQRDRETFPLSHSPARQHYRINCVDDEGINVYEVGHFVNDLPAAKRYVAKITKYAAPVAKQEIQDLGEPGNINALIVGVENALQLAMKLADEGE